MREHHNHPQTIWTVIVSAPNRYRNFSRERTHMDLEDPNGVSEGADTGCPPHLMTVGVIALGLKSFSDEDVTTGR